jgi:bifunctional non-homologous end joining protein LigD
MLIRKNTKAFKTILEIVTACQTRPDREKLIRLYITRAGHTIKDRISVESIQGDSAVFYEMNYQAVLTYLQSSNHQLHSSDDVPGIYFFRSTSNKVWDEMPFEFDESVKKEFASLPELPVLRKREKAEKFVFPTADSKTTTKVKREKVVPAKSIKKGDEEDSDQPKYKLKHKIVFTDLEKVIYRQPRLNKKEVLDYYDKISEYLLPFIKDRRLLVRVQSDRSTGKELTAEALFKDPAHVMDWIESASLSRSKVKKELLLCNDRDHLLFYVENGCLQFDPGFSKIKVVDSPDYFVIAIDGDETELSKTIEVALAAKTILDGLQLPAFVKTDGKSGLHIYVPLDSKSDFETSKNTAELICKLIRVKVPGIVVFQGIDEEVYGKVIVDYSINENGKGIIAPYSLIAGDSPTVATPLSWDEVEDGLRPEEFNYETIFKRLKKSGDIFELLFRKKVSAKDLLSRLEENYSFLFE